MLRKLSDEGERVIILAPKNLPSSVYSFSGSIIYWIVFKRNSRRMFNFIKYDFPWAWRAEYTHIWIFIDIFIKPIKHNYRIIRST